MQIFDEYFVSLYSENYIHSKRWNKLIILNNNILHSNFRTHLPNNQSNKVSIFILSVNQELNF
jgi:hypothetical protein